MDTTRRLKSAVTNKAAQNSNSADSPNGSLNSSPEGIKFVYLLLAYFFVTSTIIIVAWISRHYAHRRYVHRKNAEAAGETQVHNANHIGMFASARWHTLLRGPVAMFIMLFIIIPNVVLLVCILLGCLLAIIESWELVLGLEYMLSTVLGLSVPLTNASPVSILGIMSDFIASIWAMLLATTAMGLAAGMSLITQMTDAVPERAYGFFLFLLGVLPILLILMTAVLGVVMASIEDWSYLDGFYFMIGSVCGLANPLTTVSPRSAEGSFFEVICVSVEICMGGAIIGIVGSHPLTSHLLLLVEGNEDAQEDVEEPKETSLANGSPNQLKKSDEEDESPLLEEVDALQRQVQALEAKVLEKDALLKDLQKLISSEAYVSFASEGAIDKPRGVKQGTQMVAQVTAGSSDKVTVDDVSLSNDKIIVSL